MLRQRPREDVGEGKQPPLIRVERVDRLDLFEQRLIVRAAQRVLAAGLHQHLHEREQKLQIRRRRCETERIDLDVGPVQGDPQGPAPEIRRERVIAPAEVEDQGARAVTLQMRDEEVEEERFPTAGRPQHECVAHVVDVQIEVVRRPVGRVEHRQGFAPEVGVPHRARILRKQ